MALTYDQSATLMRDMNFQGRVKVSGLNYSTYILNEAPDAPGHSSRYRWAQQFALSPDMEATKIQPMVVMDPAVQEAGASITDAALQASVEIVINKFI